MKQKTAACNVLFLFTVDRIVNCVIFVTALLRVSRLGFLITERIELLRMGPAPCKPSIHHDLLDSQITRARRGRQTASNRYLLSGRLCSGLAGPYAFWIATQPQPVGLHA